MVAVRVKILRPGYGKPVGERYRRIINPGEIILWDGPVGNWMRDADAEEEPGEERQDIPAVLQRAMNRTRSAMTVREMQALGQEPPAEEPAGDNGGDTEQPVMPARGRGRGRAKEE